MGTWKHYNPVEVRANVQAAEELPRCMHEYASAQNLVLLVTSTGMVRRKTVENVMQNIPCTWHILEAKPEPDLDDLDIAITQLKELEQEKCTQFSTVIALGGGSVIDSAKALACGLMATDRENPLHVWLREKTYAVPDIALPIIAIPTNAGTGAEMTPFATIWDNKNKKKCSLVSRACFPKIALIDPTLTLSLAW
jgi:alcohol dehydrogenase